MAIRLLRVQNAAYFAWNVHTLFRWGFIQGSKADNIEQYIPFSSRLDKRLMKLLSGVVYTKYDGVSQKEQ